MKRLYIYGIALFVAFTALLCVNCTDDDAGNYDKSSTETFVMSLTLTCPNTN